MPLQGFYVCCDGTTVHIRNCTERQRAQTNKRYNQSPKSKSDIIGVPNGFTLCACYLVTCKHYVTCGVIPPPHTHTQVFKSGLTSQHLITRAGYKSAMLPWMVVRDTGILCALGVLHTNTSVQQCSYLNHNSTHTDPHIQPFRYTKLRM